MQYKAALTIAQENLGYTDIISPIDGRIGLTAYTEGNLVNPASGVLATIVSDDPIYVEFPVSMRQIADITADASCRTRRADSTSRSIVTLANRQEYRITPASGTTSAIRSTSRPTRCWCARIMPNPERRLVDGAFVTVEVEENEGTTRGW